MDLEDREEHELEGIADVIANLQASLVRAQAQEDEGQPREAE